MLGPVLRRLPYSQYFGGVSAVTPDQYMKMNGFPNQYWGWGGEDDDIAARWGHPLNCTKSSWTSLYFLPLTHLLPCLLCCCLHFAFFWFCLWHWLCAAIFHPSRQCGTAVALLNVGSVSMLMWTSSQLTTDSSGSSLIISANFSPLSGFYSICSMSLFSARQRQNGKYLNTSSFPPFMLHFVSGQLKIPYKSRQ